MPFNYKKGKKTEKTNTVNPLLSAPGGGGLHFSRAFKGKLKSEGDSVERGRGEGTVRGGGGYYNLVKHHQFVTQCFTIHKFQ